jgi:hypothetical protein
MNYTNYIINGKIINVESILSNRKYLKHITIAVGIPVALFGIVTLTSILPLTFLLDEAKYRRIKYKKYMRSHGFWETNI